MPRILILIGLALCVSGIWAYFDARQFQASSARVTAVVDERNEGTMLNRTPRPPAISLRYEFEGKKVHVTTNAINKYFEPLKAGDTIELVLAKGDPNKFMPAATADKAGLLGVFLTVLGAGVLVLGAFLK